MHSFGRTRGPTYGGTRSIRTNGKALLAAERETFKVSVEQFTLQHPNYGLAVFAARQLGQGEVICCYQGSLAFYHLGT